jgi:capsid protein
MAAGAVLGDAIPAIRLAEYALERKKFEAVLFKPRGWSWIKPNEEVDAYKEAIKAGFMTVSDVIAITGEGKDLEDVLRQRERELKMMAEKNLEFDTSPSVYIAAETGSQKGTGAPPPPEDGTGDTPASEQSTQSSQAGRTDIRRVV